MEPCTLKSLLLRYSSKSFIKNTISPCVASALWLPLWHLDGAPSLKYKGQTLPHLSHPYSLSFGYLGAFTRHFSSKGSLSNNCHTDYVKYVPHVILLCQIRPAEFLQDLISQLAHTDWARSESKAVMIHFSLLWWDFIYRKPFYLHRVRCAPDATLLCNRKYIFQHMACSLKPCISFVKWRQRSIRTVHHGANDLAITARTGRIGASSILPPSKWPSKSHNFWSFQQE